MTKKFIIESDGYERKAVELVCAFCGKTFLRRESQYKIAIAKGKDTFFCSPTCSNKSRIKRVEVSCTMCGKNFEVTPKRLKASKSGYLFCSYECLNKGQRVESGLTDMHPQHYNRGHSTYRDRAFRIYPHECELCGYNEFIEILEVHHIDGNRKNNSAENLIILCPNHHAMLTRGIATLENRILVLAVA